MKAGGSGKESVDGIHRLVRTAILARRPISAMYGGCERKLCPHVLGRKHGRLQVLCYQYGGASRSGLQPEDRSANWRCVALEGLSDVRLLSDPWQTAEIHSHQQTCVEQIEIDVEDQPDESRKRDKAGVAEASDGQS